MRQLRELIARNRAGSAEAIPSVCSAHPDVLAASLLLADEAGVPLLVEATSNQVNQFGGYTGMKPADFISFVRGIADAQGVDTELILFGGDHLGPQAWREQPADEAMAKARDLVEEYVRAGFTKIHLDCSEGCASERAQVGDQISAIRAAELAGVCEASADDPEAVSYVFGTEVPPPGGARAADDAEGIDPTSPESALVTIAAHREAFSRVGLEGTAWRRAVGLVVQPGLEFTPNRVHHFHIDAPDQLAPVLSAHEGLCFEAHSTDYQEPVVFPELARRHFAVLKVGPALTHAYRKAIYALDAVAFWVARDGEREPLAKVMEALMLESPKDWARHYVGNAAEVHLLRHFSYADRIRYYWTRPRAAAAVDQLLSILSVHRVPRTVLEEHFSPAVLTRADRLAVKARDWMHALIYAQIQEALAPYFGCGGFRK